MSALKNHSSFFYGWKIDLQTRYIDFNDGAPKTAILKTGTYTSSSLALEIKKQMDSLSSLDFTVTFDRTTRKFTISSTAPFSLLFSTGPYAGQSAASVIGYTATDKTASSSYLAENVSGYEYKTQLYLQSYKPTSLNRKAIDGVVNKSASGKTEVVKFGNERFMSCEMTFITNIIQEPGSIVRTNMTGREDFVQFIEWCTEKAPLEFMENESDVSTFQEFILESTEADSKGLDYDLIETYDKNLPYYYRSGKLKFKLLD
jgi:hypothetical protein